MSTVMLAELASLFGDPSRAQILAVLLDGRALTSKELASIAGIAPQTASGHLVKLVSSNLLKQDKQGRHRYFKLASQDVARMLEGMLSMAVTTMPPRYRPSTRADETMRLARICYDHLAGWLGVTIADVLVARGFVIFSDDLGEVTDAGVRFFSDLGAETRASGTRRCFCRPCLDWTERRHHLAGFVGASLTKRFLDLGWIARMRATRAIEITAAGKKGLDEIFAIKLDTA